MVQVERFCLELHSMQDLIFRIELQILHGLYTDKVSLFKGTMTMDILPDEDLPFFGDGEQTREPLRGDRGMAPGEDGIRNVWVAAIDKDLEVALPLNMPRLLPVVGHYKSEIEFMNRFMWKGPFDNNHGVSNLEYSMMNYTLRVPDSYCRTRWHHNAIRGNRRFGHHVQRWHHHGPRRRPLQSRIRPRRLLGAEPPSSDVAPTLFLSARGAQDRSDAER